jgi:CubicO group peptidase (beta-lactamase class C family)
MPNRVYGFSVGLNGTDLISSDSHYLNPAQGDGGIYSTLDDLLKWDRILYDNMFISEETKEEAFTPAILNNGDTTSYGFGWFIDKSSTGKKVVRHGGRWVGFRAYIYREIEENNCIIILTNNSSRYLRSVVEPLKNILHNQAYEFPKLAISETIGEVVMNKGANAAIEQYKKLKSNKPDEYDFAENQLNRLGYQLMQLDRVHEAIEIFRLNKEEFPQSANTYDSFGDALLASGDTTQSIINFKKALAMDSTFSATKEKIKDIEANTMSNIK